MLSIFLYLFSSMFCIGIANIIRNDCSSRDSFGIDSNKVVDILHTFIPEIEIRYLSDIMVFSQILLCAYEIPLESNMKDIDVFFYTMGTVQILKGICSVSTILPPLRKYDYKNRFGGLNGSGTEYIFSGHASYCCITFIYLYRVYTSGFLILYNVLTQLLIVVSRNHYTVDVLLAWIITFSVYLNITFLSNSLDNSPFSLHHH